MRKYKTDIEDKLRNRTKSIIVKPKPIHKDLYDSITYYDDILYYNNMVKERMTNEADYRDSRVYRHLQDYGTLC